MPAQNPDTPPGDLSAIINSELTNLSSSGMLAILILGMGSAKPVKIDDARPIVTSFPTFEALMAKLGAKLSRGNY